ncbi:MAG: DMT family transporter [Methanolinea sp.]|nr:DMT family transporter [Methanolinea sp.]
MIWPLLALTGALAQAAYSAGVKVLLSRISPWAIAGRSFSVASLLLFSLSLHAGIPAIAPGFFEAAAITVAINIVATILFYRALSVSDLSLCLPLLSFTPVFLVATSCIILGEVPTAGGLAGIFLVVGGSFLLSARGFEPGHRQWSLPFRRLGADPGVPLVVTVAFLYSISVNYDKVVVEKTDPVFGSAVVLGLLALAFIFLGGVETFLGKNPQARKDTGKKRLVTGILPLVLGLVLTVEAVSINVAYTLSLVPYVITIKRLSVFFGVILGGYLLGEGNTLFRVTGALVMVTGTALIALWG